MRHPERGRECALPSRQRDRGHRRSWWGGGDCLAATVGQRDRHDRSPSEQWFVGRQSRQSSPLGAARRSPRLGPTLIHRAAGMITQVTAGTGVAVSGVGGSGYVDNGFATVGRQPSFQLPQSSCSSGGSRLERVGQLVVRTSRPTAAPTSPSATSPAAAQASSSTGSTPPGRCSATTIRPTPTAPAST